jgi:hypothetical protein
MFASFTAKTGYCAYAAAANTSARNIVNLDTALLAVSILLSSVICVLRT